MARLTFPLHAGKPTLGRLPITPSPLPVAASGATGSAAEDDTAPMLPALDVEVDAEPDIGRAPLTVRFTVTADAEADGPLAFVWDFGDGTGGSDSPTSHTFRAAGTYTATVTVTAARGRQATRQLQLLVDPQDGGDD